MKKILIILFLIFPTLLCAVEMFYLTAIIQLDSKSLRDEAYGLVVSKSSTSVFNVPQIEKKDFEPGRISKAVHYDFSIMHLRFAKTNSNYNDTLDKLNKFITKNEKHIINGVIATWTCNYDKVDAFKGEKPQIIFKKGEIDE